MKRKKAVTLKIQFSHRDREEEECHTLNSDQLFQKKALVGIILPVCLHDVIGFDFFYSREGHIFKN